MKAAKRRDAESKKRWGTGLPGGIEQVRRDKRAVKVERAMKRAGRKIASWGEPSLEDLLAQNPGRGAKTKRLKNFTGTVSRLADGTVIVTGVQR